MWSRFSNIPGRDISMAAPGNDFFVILTKMLNKLLISTIFILITISYFLCLLIFVYKRNIKPDMRLRW